MERTVNSSVELATSDALGGGPEATRKCQEELSELILKYAGLKRKMRNQEKAFASVIEDFNSRAEGQEENVDQDDASTSRRRMVSDFD